MDVHVSQRAPKNHTYRRRRFSTMQGITVPYRNSFGNGHIPSHTQVTTDDAVTYICRYQQRTIARHPPITSSPCPSPTVS
ncbi:uncharacterized protein SCHCODRAFT_02502826 [Schizophyllum commune H4-8]|nr:uncharacterized protein SCHCODRAFT_02502826 [Schizophyllum commune H4-8]KAI5892331.1 hypothetical protein SCHCODRAFT_02502826 [Schizophyllum commune H4-8]